MFSKLITILILIINIFFFSNIVSGNISIVGNVEGEIITNYDIERESNYLMILNPNIQNLKSNQIFDLAKDSLVKEIIKKKEITKFVDIDQRKTTSNDYLENLYLKLGFENESDFSNELKKNNNYALNEIKKKIKIEMLWNELIYTRYKDQVKIDNNKLIKKIEKMAKKKQKEYLLSEILFRKKKDQDINYLIDQIKLSIKNIGFNNTANIFSISDSAKLGGKLGWVNESSLSDIVYKKLQKIKEGENTDIIKINTNFLIIKVNKIRMKNVKIDKNKELKNLVILEQNKQLNQFSRIFFDKTKINYSINEK
tara:strand:- start:108 stop:1040 length:933 start_codon:yes stop_codon:yes gene_type:complete